MRFSSLGDVVLTTPIPRLLKKKYPNSEIHFITKKIYSSIYNNNINVDKVIEFSNNLLETYKDLKKENYDLVIDLHSNLRSIFLKFLLFRKTYTYNKEFIRRWIYVNTKIDLKIKHISTSYIETLKKLGIEDDGQGLDLYIDEKEKILRSNLPKSHRNEFYALVIGAKHYTKRLPVNKIIELCDKINKPIILLGGKDDIPISYEVEKFFSTKKKNDEVEKILGKRACIHNLCGKLSISGSASIVSMSKVVYTNDTGFMHIAAALNKRVVSIFGSTHPQLGFYPYKTNFYVYQNNKLSCRPCTKIGLSKCPAGHFKCMEEIKFEDIIL